MIFDAKKDSLESIQEAIMDLNEFFQPIIIKNGLSLKSHKEWHSFLKESCGFSLDKRHYNFDESLEEQEWWEVSYQPDKEISYAYSKTAQPLHTDNSWFEDPAQINFFYMKKQAKEGGAQTIYPLDRLMEDLAREEKQLFHDLTKIPVKISKGDDKFSNNTTIIVNNEKPDIFWNYYRVQKTSPEIKKMCESFFQFLGDKEKTSSVEYSRVDTGDFFAFNDLKLLHGREAFKADEPFDRILRQSMWRLPIGVQ